MKNRKDIQKENEELREQIALLEEQIEELEKLIEVYDDFDEVKMFKAIASAVSFSHLELVRGRVRAKA